MRKTASPSTSVWAVDQDNEVYEAKVGRDRGYHGYALNAVDQDNEVYEAKVGRDRGYHGYALNADGERDLCRWVIREWKARAGTS